MDDYGYRKLLNSGSNLCVQKEIVKIFPKITGWMIELVFNMINLGMIVKFISFKLINVRVVCIYKNKYLFDIINVYTDWRGIR